MATTPVLALTASAMQEIAKKAVAAGFTGYISKPVPLKVFRAEVERLLG